MLTSIFRLTSIHGKEPSLCAIVALDPEVRLNKQARFHKKSLAGLRVPFQCGRTSKSGLGDCYPLSNYFSKIQLQQLVVLQRGIKRQDRMDGRT